MRKIARKFLIGSVATGMCFSMFSGMAAAEEEKPTADLTVAALSQYVWRGWATSKDSIVVQPSMTVGYKGFSANVWGNLDTDQYVPATDTSSNNLTETDLTLSYSWETGPVAFSAGYIYYGLDSPLIDTQEVFLSAALSKLPLSPTLKIYRDIDHLAGWYATLSVSHSLPIKDDIALSLGAQVSYLTADDENVLADPNDATKKYSGFHDGLLSASVKIPLNKYVSVTPQVAYSFPLSSDAKDRLRADNLTVIGKSDSDFVYGGVAVSLAF